jgi:WD40 repeat protein
LKSGRMLRTLEGHKEPVLSVAVSGNGKFIVSGSDETIMIWEASSGALLRSIQKKKLRVRAVAALAGGRIIASGHFDGEICLWKAESARLSRKLIGHTREVIALSESENGRELFSQDDAGRTYRWNMETGARYDATDEERASFNDARGRGPRLRTRDATIRLVGSDRTLRASFTVLPDDQWVAVGGDGSTYAGSEGCEAHLALAERDGLATKGIDDAYVREHRRERLAIKWK